MTADQLKAARAAHWRQNQNAVLTLEDAQSWFEQHPLSLFLPQRTQLPAPAPTFVEAVLGEPSATPAQAAIGRARELLVRLVAAGKVVPLNLFGTLGEHPDFLAQTEILPFVISLRGDRDWKQAPAKSGGHKVTPLVAELWRILEQDGPLDALEAREKLGREITEAAVLRALNELWQPLRAIPVLGSTPEQPARWELLQVHHRAALTSGSTMSQVTAISMLVSIYLQSVYAATGDEIEIFLSPLASRSRIREAVRGLSATRQLHSLSMDAQTYYFLEGGLPEFAPEAQAEPSQPVRRRGSAVETPRQPHAPRRAVAPPAMAAPAQAPPPGSLSAATQAPLPSAVPQPAAAMRQRRPPSGEKPGWGGKERRASGGGGRYGARAGASSIGPRSNAKRGQRSGFRPGPRPGAERGTESRSFGAWKKRSPAGGAEPGGRGPEWKESPQKPGSESRRPSGPAPGRPSRPERFSEKPRWEREPAAGARPRSGVRRESGDRGTSRPARPWSPPAGPREAQAGWRPRPESASRGRSIPAGTTGGRESSKANRGFDKGAGKRQAGAQGFRLPRRHAPEGREFPGASRVGPTAEAPAGARPAFRKPGFAKPGFNKPGSSKPGFSKPGFSKPGFSKPGFSKPGFSKPGFSKPGSSKPGFSKPGFQSDFRKPGTPGPHRAGGKPGFARPSSGPRERPGAPWRGGPDRPRPGAGARFNPGGRSEAGQGSGGRSKPFGPGGRGRSAAGPARGAGRPQGKAPRRPDSSRAAGLNRSGKPSFRGKNPLRKKPEA